VDGQAKLVAHDSDTLPEIEVRGQLSHRVLSRAHDVGRGRFQQPAGQGLLTGVRPGRRQQLEEAAASEQVQINRKWMRFRRARKGTAEDVNAVPAAADPLIGHSLQAAFVERDRGSGAVARV